MKIKIGIGLLLLFCNIVLAQNNCKCKKDSIRYATAYNYIVKDSKYKIWVSDSICDLEGSAFYSDLKDYYPKIKEKMQQYWIDNDFIGIKPFYSSCIASIFKKKESAADNMLFFSLIRDRVLVAEIYPLDRNNPYIKNNILYEHHEICRFTTGLYYLFIFNKDNTIKTVFKHTVFCD